MPIETPHIERMEVLTGKGAGSDEVLRQIFDVTNKGGTPGELALRFDLTVPLARGHILVRRQRVVLDVEVAHARPEHRPGLVDRLPNFQDPTAQSPYTPGHGFGITAGEIPAGGKADPVYQAAAHACRAILDAEIRASTLASLGRDG